MGTRAYIAILVGAVVLLAAGAALADALLGGQPSLSSPSVTTTPGDTGSVGLAETDSSLTSRSETTRTSSDPAPSATTAAVRSPTTSSPPPTIEPEPVTTSTSATTAAPVDPTRPRESGVVVAWQPSHQDDTGGNSWHEYKICGDIVQRTMDAAPTVRHILAWETGMGLTGSNNNGGTNRRAFDSELDKANKGAADYFISVHNDGGAPSGVLGMYFVGDKASAAYAERFAQALAKKTGLPYRGVRGHDLYSLDSTRNDASIRILLEIGDNQADRAFLEDPASRQKIAETLAKLVAELPKPD